MSVGAILACWEGGAVRGIKKRIFALRLLWTCIEPGETVLCGSGRAGIVVLRMCLCDRMGSVKAVKLTHSDF